MHKSITLYLSIDVPSALTAAQVIEHISDLGPVTLHREPCESILDLSADQWAITLTESHGVLIAQADPNDATKGYRWSRGQSVGDETHGSEADAARSAIRDLKLHAIASVRDQQGLTALPSHPLGGHEPHWTAGHSQDAMREGWDIYQLGSDGGRDWQVQRIDDATEVERRHGITSALLKDDADAWQLIYQGNEQHHAAARAFLQEHSKDEWASIEKVGRFRSAAIPC